MKRLARLPGFRPALTLTLLAVLGVIFVNYDASAQTTDVQVTIPEGIIVVQGKASPNAQIKLYENGNDQPTASVVADSSGNFSEELPQMSTGVVDISILAIDTNGVASVLVTKQVAIISQQTSTLTVILPPSASVNPESAPFGQGIMEFSGRTIPGATVKIIIEPSTILSTTADSQGNYMIPLLVGSLASVGIYTYGIEVIIGSEISDYVVVGTFVIAPPVQQPLLTPISPIQNFVGRIVNKPIAAPEITSPSASEYNSSNPLVISGRAPPGTEVFLYDNGEIIGVVIAGEDGTWQFYFSPHKETHSIYAKACKNEKCSESSRVITIRRPNSGDLVCRPGVELTTYRLSAVTGSETNLIGNLLHEQSGLVVISWGDTTDERFNISSNGQLNSSHTYKQAGIYSGYIIVNNGTSCQTATYFAVEVTNPTQPMTWFVLIAIIVAGVLAIGLSLFRFLPRLRP